ncbi:MAG: SRPBCC domain-containing protein [Cryomorphaceae bacterium]|nr:SRPBCC domain-containing protein [Cryomorphaceae bacterium]
MEKVLLQKEYLLNASKSILFNCLSTPSGLSEWFADDVNIRNEVYTFKWDDSEEEAKLITKKRDEYIKFKWLDDEDDDSYFDMRIRIDAMTGETALIVNDYVDEDEIEESSLLWDSLVDNLRRILGC